MNVSKKHKKAIMSTYWLSERPKILSRRYLKQYNLFDEYFYKQSKTWSYYVMINKDGVTYGNEIKRS